MFRYAIEIFYGEEDEEYIAVVPELPGCSAFGETEEALEEVKTAMNLWLEKSKKEHRKIQKPQGKEMLKAVYKDLLLSKTPSANK